MSLYNLLFGVRELTFFAIPMLGDKHPDAYPRFRDVFAEDPEHPEYDQGRGDAYYIHLYTRVGGNNRGDGYGEDELYEHPQYVATFDDNFDSTYATYIFRVPEQWVADWQHVLAGDYDKISPALRAQCEKVFPKLAGKWPWDKVAAVKEDA
jgi:hypothetical protein